MDQNIPSDDSNQNRYFWPNAIKCSLILFILFLVNAGNLSLSPKLIIVAEAQQNIFFEEVELLLENYKQKLSPFIRG